MGDFDRDTIAGIVRRQGNSAKIQVRAELVVVKIVFVICEVLAVLLLLSPPRDLWTFDRKPITAGKVSFDALSQLIIFEWTSSEQAELARPTDGAKHNNHKKAKGGLGANERL
ncbi:hypothetical protein EDB82DRAFT_472281 [Fusarium venenatum]|uniref:uncharacterized protein n=1 Tax=Fusarium venenatum TaxID=56646 RepID=UPI001DD8452A|nr:hypothetical protein EDB82DRAFT_472281 [Fusarium venenatum]